MQQPAGTADGEQVTLGTAYLTYRLFKTIPEYTTTLPTGQTPGKLWRCRGYPNGWLLGMYGDPEEKTVPIYWLDVVIIEGPERAGLDPDWHNDEHYQRLRKKERAEAQRQEGVS